MVSAIAQELLARLVTPAVGWDVAGIAALLDEVVARAAERWPALHCDAPAWASALARALDPSVPPARAFAAIQALDVVLADACARGDAEALAIFERELMPIVDRALGRAGADAQAELRQRVRANLFVPRASAPAAIAGYAGRAPLSAWLRVVATREAGALARAEHHVPADDDEIDGMAASALDPDLQIDRVAYQDELRDAFAEAFAKLDSSERTLLRMHLLDRVGIDELAAMHSVHRATAARWVKRLREQLFTDTRRGLMRRLHLSPSEFDSAMRLVRSQLDVSISRHLRDE
jgi:RNA polymerase sigma-70 factor (ECF subfamily)